MAKPVYATGVVEQLVGAPRPAVWGALVVATDDQHTGSARWSAAGHDFEVRTLALEPPWRVVHELHGAPEVELVQITAVLVEQGDDTLAMWSVLVGPDGPGDADLAERLRAALADRLAAVADAARRRPTIADVGAS